MSHMTTVKTEIKDLTTLKLSLEKNPEVEWQKHGTFQLYSGTATGYGIKLRGWTYPIVVTEDGTIQYDNYGGRWGNEAELNALVQNYAVEKVKRSWKRKHGTVLSEKKQQDGQVRLVLRA